MCIKEYILTQTVENPSNKIVNIGNMNKNENKMYVLVDFIYIDKYQSSRSRFVTKNLKPDLKTDMFVYTKTKTRFAKPESWFRRIWPNLVLVLYKILLKPKLVLVSLFDFKSWFWGIRFWICCNQTRPKFSLIYRFSSTFFVLINRQHFFTISRLYIKKCR